MPIGDFGERTYGLRKLTVVSLDTSDLVELDAGQMVAFGPVFDAGQLRGKDHIVEVGARITAMGWELQAGGIPLDALQVLLGGALTSSGTGAGEEASWYRDYDQSLPYFQIMGQAISVEAGQLIVVLNKCKVTGGPEGSLSMGQFALTACEGVAEADDDGEIYRIIQHDAVGGIWTVGSSAVGGDDYIGG